MVIDIPVKQNQLIAQQNKLISYVSGLGIVVGADEMDFTKETQNKRWEDLIKETVAQFKIKF